jgi:sigma-B regulation protein RsbU (phosphoserine phosphatase)
VITLHDIIHLPVIEPWFGRIAERPGGLVVIAGLESDGLSGVLGILWRHMLQVPGAGGEPRRAYAIGARPRFVRAARSQRAQITYVRTAGPRAPTYAEALERATEQGAGLIALDELTAENLGHALQAASYGLAVVAPLETVLAGGQVIAFLADLGAPEPLLRHIGWVLTVQRLCAVCRECGEPWVPSPSDLEAVGLRPKEAGEERFYRNRGCSVCRSDETRPLITAFDVYRHDAERSAQADGLRRASDLSLRSYALGLARQGYVPLTEVRNLETGVLRRAQALLLRRQEDLSRSEADLRAKVAALEASQRTLQSSYEALISLQDVTQTLASSTDEDLSRRILHYARETLEADLVVLYLIEPDGYGRMAALAGWKAEAESCHLSPAEVSRWLARAAEADDPALDEGELPPGVRRPGDREGARAGLLLVLTARANPVGLLFVQSTVKRRFSIAERNLLQMFADQAAVAIQRRRLVAELQAKIAALEEAQAELIQKERLEHELELAREIQQSFLPTRFPTFPGLQVAARSVPARAVGGDFYDAFALPGGRVGIVIADVSDKGMPAALFMALTRSLVRAEAQREASPARVLASANRLLLDMSDSAMFVTAFYGVLRAERGELTYARAGHERPLHYRAAERACTPLPGEGIALGILGSAVPEEATVTLQPGDELVLFTDGVTEQLLASGEEFGHERLAQAVAAHAGLDLNAQCEVLFANVTASQAGPEPSDDRAILLVRLEQPAGQEHAKAARNQEGEV